MSLAAAYVADPLELATEHVCTTLSLNPPFQPFLKFREDVFNKFMELLVPAQLDY